MQFITATLMALWLWEFLRSYLTRLPDWIIHLTLIPSIAYVSWCAPAEIRNILGIAGGVLLVQLLSNRSIPVPVPSVKGRRSNIPPLP
jgi:hypothetical protein